MRSKKQYSLLDNSRFYILVFSFLLSLATVAWLRLNIASDQVFYIRLQQVFGLASVAWWYLALVISPVGYIVGQRRIGGLKFARRAIGVSAFYFAVLHSVVAVFGQLGGVQQITYLPELFKWSLGLGLVALVILLILTITSFDAVVKYMTFVRWKWLHQLVYLGGVLAMLHIWMIGTHLAYTGTRVGVFIMLVILLGLELYRITKLINDKYLQFGRAEMFIVFLALWLITTTFIFVLPSYVQNYHSRHRHVNTESR